MRRFHRNRLFYTKSSYKIFEEYFGKNYNVNLSLKSGSQVVYTHFAFIKEFTWINDDIHFEALFSGVDCEISKQNVQRNNSCWRCSIYGFTEKFIESGLLNASFLGSFATTGRGQAIEVAPSEATFWISCESFQRMCFALILGVVEDYKIEGVQFNSKKNTGGGVSIGNIWWQK